MQMAPEAQEDAIERDTLRASLTNQPVSEATAETMERLRVFAKAYGDALVALVPYGRQKALAKTHLEDSVMWAIKGLVMADLKAD